MTGGYYKNDLLYPELSYKIVGVLFDVFKALGYGLREKGYQDAIAYKLKDLGVEYKKELPVKIQYKDKQIGINYLDFMIEDKVVLEIKRGSYFAKPDIDQLFSYLKLSGLKLGILARFTKEGVKFKRIVNLG